MAKTVVGLFDTFEDAQSVVQDLVDSGFPRNDISLVMSDTEGRFSTVRGDESAPIAQGAGAGAVGGGIVGGVIGLLVGIGALAIPGIGPVLAAGPLATSLGAAVGSTAVGAGIGAVAGGLIGALVSMGIPEEEAQTYAEGVRRGGTLIAVTANEAMVAKARDIMERHNPVDVDERAAQWRQSGWAGYQETGGTSRPGAMGPGFTHAQGEYVREEGTFDRGLTDREVIDETNEPRGTFATGMAGERNEAVTPNVPEEFERVRGTFAAGVSDEGEVVEESNVPKGSFATGMREDENSMPDMTGMHHTAATPIADETVTPEEQQHTHDRVRVYDVSR